MTSKPTQYVTEDIDIEIEDKLAGSLEEIKQNIDDIQAVFGDKYKDLHIKMEPDYDGCRFSLIGTRIETEEEMLRRLKYTEEARQRFLKELRIEKERILARQEEIEEHMRKLRG